MSEAIDLRGSGGIGGVLEKEDEGLAEGQGWGKHAFLF